jgi:hypothetical protein
MAYHARTDVRGYRVYEEGARLEPNAPPLLGPLQRSAKEGEIIDGAATMHPRSALPMEMGLNSIL